MAYFADILCFSDALNHEVCVGQRVVAASCAVFFQEHSPELEGLSYSLLRPTGKQRQQFVHNFNVLDVERFNSDRDDRSQALSASNGISPFRSRCTIAQYNSISLRRQRRELNIYLDGNYRPSSVIHNACDTAKYQEKSCKLSRQATNDRNN